MFNDTITIYNHYYDKLTKLDRWNRTVLKDVMWRQTTTKTVSSNKIQIDDSISITIPHRSGYLSPQKYIQMPNDKMSDYWTINAKNNVDIIVLGEINQDLTDSYTLRELRKDYDNVVTVMAVSDNSRVDHLKHWKVTAK